MILFCYNVVQCQEVGFLAYISDLMNLMDVANIILYTIFCPLRLWLGAESLLDFFEFEQTLSPEDPKYRTHYYWKFTLTIVNVMLCPITGMQFLNYLRINENFGLFMLLIGEVINDTQIFMLFMFMWDFIFTILLYILNSGVVNEEDYPMLPFSLKLLGQIWRNSLGDIQPPDYSFWMTKIEEYS